MRISPAKLVRSAAECAVAKLIQVSALQASTAAPSHYLRTKGEAERVITDTADFPWTILATLGDLRTRRFLHQSLRASAATGPGLFPLAMPGARFAPVHVDDVVEAIVRAIDDVRHR